jgi:hypothetical protein
MTISRLILILAAVLCLFVLAGIAIAGVELVKEITVALLLVILALFV